MVVIDEKIGAGLGHGKLDDRSVAIFHPAVSSSGTFGDAVWTPISYPNSTLTSANTVYESNIIGIYQLGTDVSSGYVATIP